MKKLINAIDSTMKFMINYTLRIAVSLLIFSGIWVALHMILGTL